MQHIRWKLIVFFLLLLPLLWAQGNVSATVSQLGQTSVWVIQFNWTGDSGGNVPVTAAGNLPAVQGYEITQIECAPGTLQPSATYGVAVLDSSGNDVLAGAANNVSGGQAQTFNAASSTPPLQGTLRLQVTKNTVAGAQGVVYVFLQKPGTLSAKKIRNMGAGGGGSFTADWLTLANAPFMDARRYNFPPQAPGGTLIAGSNTITLQPCPIGLNGTDPNHYLYISGGTGTAEAVLITGGGCLSGNASSTVTFTAANTHSGAWTIQSASGGLQEAICALPAAGGIVGAPVSVTLYANVGTCGKTAVVVDKFAGLTLSGTYTILSGSSTGTTQAENFRNTNSSIYDAGPNWSTLGSVRDTLRSMANNFPAGEEYFQNTAGVQVSVAGGTDVPSGTSVQGIGVAGYGRTASITAGQGNAIGVFGLGILNGPGQAWGANFGCNPFASSGPNAGKQFAGGCWTLELDTGGNSSSPPPSYLFGMAIVAAGQATPTGSYDAIQFLKSTAGAIAFKTGIEMLDGSVSGNAIYIGATGTGNGVASMPIAFASRDPGGNVRISNVLADNAGDLVLRGGNPPSGTLGQVVFEDGSGNIGANMIPNGSTPYFQIVNQLRMGSNATVLIPALKATTGQRYVCVDVNGQLQSSATACSGT